MCQNFTVSFAENEPLALLGRRADPLLKVGRVPDVEYVIDVHGQRQADVVIVAAKGDAGHHGAHRGAAVQGVLVDGAEQLLLIQRGEAQSLEKPREGKRRGA